ncbi:HEPN domain-containing protein [Pinirhizobacter soli]|uniref:HEPN domain-containing protein n=1 Tax=Pinirhizobacter soli TaxID=2786953 RepID=UPI00202A3CC8|nr:HEPN domain-containing protein [Pinirhizobacter soli]
MNGRQEVDKLKKRLDATISRAPSPTAEPEVQSDFAKYCCILVSGFFENAVVALVLHYVEKRSAPEIASFVEAQLDRWTNPKADKLCNLLRAFNKDWGKQAEAYLVDERRDSINSLVALRHKIAHGESVQTSLSQVKSYKDVVYEVVEFVATLTGQ